MEVSCDAKVIDNLNKEESNNYSLAVLYAVSGKTLYSSAFGGAKIKVRLENILSYKKLTIGSVITILVFILSIAIVLLTNAPV